MPRLDSGAIPHPPTKLLIREATQNWGRKELMAKNITATDTYRAVLQTDYCEYVKYVHQGSWQKTPFHHFLCKYVQNFIQRPTDKPYEILAISTPPQHGKSQSITETLPSWYLGNYPNNRVIEVSYNEDFAIKFGRANKRKIAEYGDDIFGIRVAKDSNRAVEFDIADHAGGMISRGILTGITGQKANLIIIDDPIKNRTEAYSKSRREQIYNEWLMSIKSRIWAGGKVIVIMTRWHEDDLVGRLLKEEENIKLLAFPCECESENDLLGRKIGDALCPEIGKGNAWLQEFKKSFTTQEGLMTWNALYQNRPTAMEGNIIGRDWWSYYDSEAEMPHIHTWVMSVDASFKDEEQSDFVAIQIWGKTGANIYLIDAVKKHLNFPDTIMEIRRLRGMYPECKTTLIEDRANGSAIITMLRREMFGIIPVQPIGSKMARVQAILGAIESGNVYLPKNKRFTADFVEECSAFPNAAHDDQVDAMSQALNRLIYQKAMNPVKEKLNDFDAMFPLWRKNKGGKGHGKVQVV